MMIKAVILDYFGVMSSNEYWRLVKTDKNLTLDFLHIANRVNLGKLSWRDFMQTIAERTDKTLAEIKAMYEQERINPQIVELVHKLKAQYKIGLITNAHHEFLEPILRDTELDKLFDTIVVSSRVGYIKPSPQIFQLALDKLQVQPNETVFIDDIERNTQAANELGIKAIYYQNFEQLKAELDKIL